jgi:hypothetical protein
MHEVLRRYTTEEKASPPSTQGSQENRKNQWDAAIRIRCFCVEPETFQVCDEEEEQKMRFLEKWRVLDIHAQAIALQILPVRSGEAQWRIHFQSVR